MDRVEQDWSARHRVSGFGSGEGFIEHAASQPGDAIYMVESELARLLAVASREGSAVSAVLRHAYDFRRIEHRIRKTVHDAPAAPVTLIGHVTVEELRDALRHKAIEHGIAVEVREKTGGRDRVLLRAAEEAVKAVKASWWTVPTFGTDPSAASTAFPARVGVEAGSPDRHPEAERGP